MFIFKPSTAAALLILCLPLLSTVGCNGSSSAGSGNFGSRSSSSSSSSGGISGEITFDNLYALTNIPIGVAVAAGSETHNVLDYPAQQETIIRHFNQITAGNIMKMSYLHSQESTYTFQDADALVNWASANGLSVHGHTFIWHSDYQVPDWMTGYSGDFAAMLDDHVTTIAAHFANTVVESWDVVNEGIDESQPNCYRNSLFYQRAGAAYIENAFRAADAADSDADLYYNDYSIEDGNSDKFACLLQIVDGLLADNVPIDGVGFQMHVQIGAPGTDGMAIAFEEIVDRGLKVKITEMDVPINNLYAAGFPQYDEFTAAEAELQKQRYHDIVETYLDAVPADQRGGITVWGLWDSDSWLLSFPGREGVDDWPLLFIAPGPEGPFTPKPALQGFGDALTGM